MNFYIIFISFCHYSFVILLVKVTLKLVNARINAKLKIKFTFFNFSLVICIIQRIRVVEM